MAPPRAITRLAAMPGKPLKALFALAAAVAALAGCGSSSSDKTIPPSAAQILNQQLSAVQQAVASGDCKTALSDAQHFVDTVNQLPDTTGPDVKTALRTAGDQLKTLASDPAQCQPTGTTGITGSTPDTTTTTSSTPPPTSTTETTTTATTTTSTKSIPAPSPTGGGGDSQGGGKPGGADGGTSGGTGGTGTGGTGKR